MIRKMINGKFIVLIVGIFAIGVILALYFPWPTETKIYLIFPVSIGVVMILSLLHDLKKRSGTENTSKDEQNK